MWKKSPKTKLLDVSKYHMSLLSNFAPVLQIILLISQHATPFPSPSQFPNSNFDVCQWQTLHLFNSNYTTPFLFSRGYSILCLQCKIPIWGRPVDLIRITWKVNLLLSKISRLYWWAVHLYCTPGDCCTAVHKLSIMSLPCAFMFMASNWKSCKILPIN